MQTVTMPMNRIEGLSLPVSKLVQGTMMLSTTEQQQSNELLDAILEMGCNTFDCGWVYGGGDCERAMGVWQESRGNRDQILILTKGAHHNADRKKVTPFDITADLHDSLARLRTDYVDIYLLHRDDPSVPVGPIVEVLHEHYEAGRIKCYGGSNWSVERIEQANAYAAAHGLKPFTVSSPNFSLAEQVESPWGDDCVTISGPEKQADRDWYMNADFPLFTWSSLARGFFSGRWSRENYEGMLKTDDSSSVHAYCHEANFQRLDRVHELASLKNASVPQIALAYVLAQPLNLHALVGCRTAVEFADNVKALTLKLTDAECAYLNLQTESL